MVKDYFDGYLDALMKEWNIYLSMMKEKPVIRELHLGGHLNKLEVQKQKRNQYRDGADEAAERCQIRK